MISIIIPFYCTKKEYFDKCMESLLAGSTGEFEILVVDDGSPEEFRGTLRPYEAWEGVRVIYKEHAGVSAARNRGIEEAAGSRLTFIDSDDFTEPGFISELQKMEAETEADVIVFNGYAEKNGNTFRNRFILEENIDYAAGRDLKNIVMGAGLSLGRVPEPRKCLFSLGSPYTKLIRTSFLRENGICFDSEIKFAEDALFSLQLYRKAERIYYRDLYLYHYNMNQDSVTGKYRKGLNVDMDQFFAAVKNFMVENGLGEDLKEAYEIRAFLEAQRCVRQEFWHKDNPEGKAEKIRQTKAFLSREPYCAALRSEYPYMKSRAAAAAAKYLTEGKYSQYMRMYGILGTVRKITHRM